MNKKFFLVLGLIPVLGVAFAGKQSDDIPLIRANTNNRFIADMQYSDTNAYNRHAQELNKQIAEEGMVLLKNEGNVLPFKGVSRISVFGKASTDPQLGGGGSGSGSVSQGITKVDLQKSLEDAGYELNPTLTAFYKDNNQSGSGRSTPTKWDGTGYNTVGETPINKYTDSVKASFSSYNDAAVILLARAGTEGADCRAANAKDADNDPSGPSGKHYLELSKNEMAMIEMVKENFNKIVVLINSGNAFQCDQFENDDAISAVIWTGTPGANGFAAVGEILNGTINPSGKTVDTWERDFTKNPTFQNFADNAQTNETDIGADGTHYPQDTMFNPDGSPVAADGFIDEEHKIVKGVLNGVRSSSFVSYEEGIYMDYRYYETRYADLEAEQKGKGDTWYNGAEGVIFPFGYGLSYTTFTQEIVSSNLDGQTFTDANAKGQLKVKVTNEGSVAGKDVVQAYWKAPYTDKGIEKAYEVLCAFAKTDLLQPGESQVVDLDFVFQDLASYDFSDANKNGFKGYELEGGDYEVSINKSAHEVYDKVAFKIQKNGFWYKYDRYTGYTVENRFSGNDFYSSIPLENDIEFTQMSRHDMEDSFPTHPTEESRTLKEGSRVEEFYTHGFTLADLELSDDGEYVPLTARKTKEDFIELGWTQVPEGQTLSKAESTQFKEMVGVPLDDERWDEFLNEFTYKELIQFVVGGSNHNPAITRIDKPSTGDSDGPSKFKTMWWCGGPTVAATYNIELAHEQGECIGVEAHNSGTYGWAGPGVNLHRSPFAGRNFEYYSADPFLTGRIAGRVVAAATDKGVYCYFKHFAVNDQEKNREGVSAFLTEQALRELYLKPFQMCVQEGHSMGIMSSYNRIGLMETAASYPLLTEVLRNEWGFKGSIISDMTHRGASSFHSTTYENINNRVLAGCNNQLDSSSFEPDCNATWDNDAFDGKGCPVFTHDGVEYESYSWWYAVRQMAKGAMYICANCGAMDRTFVLTAQGMEFDGVVDGAFHGNINQSMEIDINLPSTLAVGQEYNGKSISAVELSIDPVTPLPDGLALEGNKISGTPTKQYNGYIHVLVSLTVEGSSDPVLLGESFELFVAPEVVQPTPKGAGKKGCKGSVESTITCVGLLGVVTALALFATKKKRVAE